MVIQKNTYQEEVPEFVIEFISHREKFKDYPKIKTWINESPANRKTLDELIEVWKVSLIPGRKDNYDEVKAWKNFKNSISVTDLHKTKGYSMFPEFNKYRWIVAVAAILCIILVLTFLFYKNPSTGSNQLYSEFIVPYGSKSRVFLPDSSMVWINAGSQIKYNDQFNTKNRNIFLSGEAYFEIKASKHPFVVITNKIKIRALGTKFNIKAYPEEKMVETTVMKGIVEIYNRQLKNADKIILKSNQQVEIRFKTPNENILKNSETLEHKTTEHRKQFLDSRPKVIINRIQKPEQISSWKDNRWIIESEELQDLAKKLERKYDIKIVFKDESLKKYVFSGILKDETVEQVLEAIKLTAPIRFELKDNVVTLYELKALKSKLQINN